MKLPNLQTFMYKYVHFCAKGKNIQLKKQIKHNMEEIQT